jgi:hypothetical protein
MTQQFNPKMFDVLPRHNFKAINTLQLTAHRKEVKSIAGSHRFVNFVVVFTTTCVQM